MTRSVLDALDNLDAQSVTVSALEALDHAVPGQWHNITSARDMVVHVTGEDVPAVVAIIEGRARVLEADPERNYAKALAIFELVDTIDQVAAGATAVSKAVDLFGGLDFLKKFTPKPETTQSLDAAIKLAAELVAFCLLRGMPQATFDGITDFAIALQQYGKSDIMRIAAWVVIDGLIPLGPNFMSTLIAQVERVTASALADHKLFDAVGDKLPGDSAADKQAFILQALRAVEGWVSNFIQEKGLSAADARDQLGSALSLAQGGADYLGAALDAMTSYVSHTGTQTVARVLVQDAYQGLRDEVWAEYVDSMR